MELENGTAEVVMINRSLAAATAPHVEAGRRFVRSLESRGGTMMLPALEHIMAMPQEPGTVRDIVVLTDGDLGNEEQIFASLGSNLGDARLFTVAIGSAPNHASLPGRATALASGTGGLVIGRRGLKIVALVGLSCGLVLTSRDAYLKAKGLLARSLIRRNWALRADGRGGSPWPGADIQPVARLVIPERGYDEIVLEDVRQGDLVILEWRDNANRTGSPHRSRYRVQEVSVVDPRDTRALRESLDDRLTLVTCYPFGPRAASPKLYVVVASREV